MTNGDKGGRAQGGFTLLEIIVSVAILLLITITVSRFTELTVQSAEFSRRSSDEALACNGLRHLLAAQLSSLPAGLNGALVGMNIKSSNGRRDAMQMVCPAGNALLTPDAKGNYQLTLLVREIPRGSGKLVLGLDREPWVDDDADDDDEDTTPGAAVKPLASLHPAQEKLPSDWVSLLSGVRQLEIAYFDARLNSWVDRWTDQTILPNLVRLRLTLEAGQPPYEIVERVPGGGLKRVPAQANFTVAGHPGTQIVARPPTTPQP